MIRGWISFGIGFVFLVAAVTGALAQANPVRSIFEAGWEAYQENDYKGAKVLFEKLVDVAPQFAPGYYALGKVYQDSSADPLECLWYFYRAITIDPNYPHPYEGICRAYYQAGDMARAEQACLTAIKLDPNLYPAKLSMAWIYLIEKSDPINALPYFEHVRAAIDSPVVLFGMGMCYAKLDRNAQVVEMISLLREKGALDMAGQLEAVLRGKANPEQMIPYPLFINLSREPEKFQSRVVGPRADEAVKETLVAEPMIPEGMPSKVEIHLQGQIPIPVMPQMYNLQGQVEQPVYGGQKEQHPGSLSPTE